MYPFKDASTSMRPISVLQRCCVSKYSFEINCNQVRTSPSEGIKKTSDCAQKMDFCSRKQKFQMHLPTEGSFSPVSYKYSLNKLEKKIKNRFIFQINHDFILAHRQVFLNTDLGRTEYMDQTLRCAIYRGSIPSILIIYCYFKCIKTSQIYNTRRYVIPFLREFVAKNNLLQSRLQKQTFNFHERPRVLKLLLLNEQKYTKSTSTCPCINLHKSITFSVCLLSPKHFMFKYSSRTQCQ